MKFIIPQNYNFKSKIFGFIDYSAAILDLIWGGLIYIILNIFFKKLSIKIVLFIIVFLPIFIFSIVGVHGENLIYFLTYIIKYVFKQKLYFYEKD